MEFYSTKHVAEILGIRPDYLCRAVWLGKVKQPDKSPQGSYLWTTTDIEAASWSLHCRAEFNRWFSEHSIKGAEQ